MQNSKCATFIADNADYDYTYSCFCGSNFDPNAIQTSGATGDCTEKACPDCDNPCPNEPTQWCGSDGKNFVFSKSMSQIS